MFCLKAIFLIAFLSLVNAAITVNMYEDDLVLENVKDLGSCNWRACDQICRRLGFPGGVCVGDKCKCDNFRINYKLVLENDKDLDSCNWRACDQLCRLLGFPGGVCVGDKCKCDNFRLNNKEQDEGNALQGCVVTACIKLCQRMNYIGGICRNGFCYCY